MYLGVTWQRVAMPSEGVEPPEEERAATSNSSRGPMSPELMGVAASDPAVGFKSLSRHQSYSNDQGQGYPEDSPHPGGKHRDNSAYCTLEP